MPRRRGDNGLDDPPDPNDETLAGDAGEQNTDHDGENGADEEKHADGDDESDQAQSESDGTAVYEVDGWHNTVDHGSHHARHFVKGAHIIACVWTWGYGWMGECTPTAGGQHTSSRVPLVDEARAKEWCETMLARYEDGSHNPDAPPPQSPD